MYENSIMNQAQRDICPYITSLALTSLCVFRCSNSIVLIRKSVILQSEQSAGVLLDYLQHHKMDAKGENFPSSAH